MDKVYCSNCKYYSSFLNVDDCNAPENIRDSYSKSDSGRRDKPWWINCTNNCKYYKRSWWRFWV